MQMIDKKGTERKEKVRETNMGTKSFPAFFGLGSGRSKRQSSGKSTPIGWC